MRLFRPLRAMASFSLAASLFSSSFLPAQQDAASPVFRATVRRVVLDVIVTDSAGKPVRGLTRNDFAITEDDKPQQVLSFDANGFAAAMDYLPPKLPAEPPNTVVNLPTTPEKGPLYVLLYDAVNMDDPTQIGDPNDFSAQMSARLQLSRFIQDKPAGTRFAIFLRSDKLRLVQGFTSDKAELAAALDPHSKRPHVPQVFMMGANTGQGESGSALWILRSIANYLDGLPGRKNLIWFSGGFPLSLLASDDDGVTTAEQIRSTLDLIARDQIAIYPVDVRGVAMQNPHGAPGASAGGGILSDARDKGLSSPGTPAAASGSQAAAAASARAGGGAGYSLLAASYRAEDDIARATGGRAFYSNNDLALALTEATENGASYYTLTYSPTNHDYNGKPRSIRVAVKDKGYKLQYRRSYYGADVNGPVLPQASIAAANPAAAPHRGPGDTLYANMEHGAPIAHDLLFGAHVRTLGAPAMGTPEQMAELATQPAYFKVRRKNAPAKPTSPIALQKFVIDYTIMAHQLQIQAGGAPPNLEIAAAAYDDDGTMLNAIVNNATTADGSVPATLPARKAYRAEQQIDLPLAAKTLRIAVRDVNTDRIGAMEIKLPLAPENESASATQATPAKTD
jgi:VWFA-related protein